METPMRLPTTRELGRSTVRLASFLIVTLSLSCADSTAPEAGGAASLRRGHGGDSGGWSSESPAPVQQLSEGVYEFTVTTRGGLFFVGPHLISFGENAICDPELSTYGPTEWDKPCAALDRPITIRAEVTEVNGHPRIDFSPELRFTPKNWMSQGVWLYLFDGSVDGDNSGSGSSDSSNLEIFWVPTDGGPLVDEDTNDADVRTTVDKDSKVVFRQIKHFSGYTVDLCRDSAEYE
jgi:hypothetical protein